MAAALVVGAVAAIGWILTDDDPAAESPAALSPTSEAPDPTDEPVLGDPAVGGSETAVEPVGAPPVDATRYCPHRSGPAPGCRITTSLSKPAQGATSRRAQRPALTTRAEIPSVLGQPAILDAADPAVLVDGQTYFVFSTSAQFMRVPVAVIPAADLVRNDGGTYAVRSSVAASPAPPNSAPTSSVVPAAGDDSSITAPPGATAVAPSSTSSTTPASTTTSVPTSVPTSGATVRTTDPASVVRQEAMPVTPPWAAGDDIWAPTVARLDGRYVMFFAAKRPAPPDPANQECVGRAVASLPEGPYVPDPTPFTCGLGGIHGALDPSIFRDRRDGRAYLHVAFGGTSTPLWTIPLTGDGNAAGRATPLLRMQHPWETWFLENPAMVFNGTDYTLTYSAGDWKLPAYATGVARCWTPVGPCTSLSGGPWLATRGEVSGPGGLSFFVAVDGSPMVAFHGYRHGAEAQYGARHTFFRRVSVSSGSIRLQ